MTLTLIAQLRTRQSLGVELRRLPCGPESKDCVGAPIEVARIQIRLDTFLFHPRSRIPSSTDTSSHKAYLIYPNTLGRAKMGRRNE